MSDSAAECKKCKGISSMVNRNNTTSVVSDVRTIAS